MTATISTLLHKLIFASAFTRRPHSLLESVLADARFEASATGLKKGSDLDNAARDEDAPNLRGNTALLRWALDNVGRNALRFSTAGQSVHVKLAYDQDTQRYAINIVDDGSGAPAAASHLVRPLRARRPNESRMRARLGRRTARSRPTGNDQGQYPDGRRAGRPHHLPGHPPAPRPGGRSVNHASILLFSTR